MRRQDTLKITLDDVQSKSEKYYKAILEIVTNAELSFDRIMKLLEDHEPSRIILRNEKLNAIKEEGYERKFESFLKLIANSWRLTHVELLGISINTRFFKDLTQAISELGKTEEIKVSLGILI